MRKRATNLAGDGFYPEILPPPSSNISKANEPIDYTKLPPTCTISVRSSNPPLVNNKIPAAGATLVFDVTPSLGAIVISVPTGTQVQENTTASPIPHSFQATVKAASSDATRTCSFTLQQKAANSTPAASPSSTAGFSVRGKISSISATDGLVGWVCQNSNQAMLPGLEIELSNIRTTIQAFQERIPSNSEAISLCSGFGNPFQFRVPYYFLADHVGKSVQVYAIPSFSRDVKVLLTDSNRYTVPGLPSAPTCTFSVTRQSNSANCNVSIHTSGTGAHTQVAPQVNKQDPAPGGAWIIDLTARGNWNGINWTGTVSCPTDRTSAISAYLKLSSGDLSQPCSESASVRGAPIMIGPIAPSPKPTCTFSVSRQGTTSTCNISVQASSAVGVASFPPQINKQDPVPEGTWIIEPSASGSWNGSNWTGTASCPTDRTTAFSSYLVLAEGGLSEACNGQPIVVPPPSN